MMDVQTNDNTINEFSRGVRIIVHDQKYVYQHRERIQCLMAWLAHFGPRDRCKGNIYHIVQNPLTNANVFFSVILFFFGLKTQIVGRFCNRK